MSKRPKITEEQRKEVRDFFGIPKDFGLKPIPCNTFIKLVKIYATLPDQENNPFAKYIDDPDYAECYPWPQWTTIGFDRLMDEKTDEDGVRDNSLPRKNTDGSNVCVGESSGVEVGESSCQKEINSDLPSGASCKDAVLNGPEMAIDQSGTSKGSEILDKITYNGDNVRGNLSSIQRILMDESDDVDMLQLLDKDANLSRACDFGSILDMDKSSDESLTVKNTENEKSAAIDEAKRKDVEGNQSTFERNVGIRQSPMSVDTGVSSSPEFVKQKGKCLKDARPVDTKLSAQKFPQELTDIGSLTSVGREIEKVGEFTSGKLEDNLGERNRIIVSGLRAKGKKTKVKNGKVSEKNVESSKLKCSQMEGEAYDNMRLGGDRLMAHGKTVKQNALTISRSPSKIEVQLSQDQGNLPKGRDRLQYTREQLLNLGKTAFVPEHIKKAVREIGVEIQEKHQISAAFNAADSSIPKKKRGGSLSEAKKEKKKMKKRKKRAELNRKLGVKRLKLQPIVKPKVVQHCRHYLMGRCHEGEKCKFSHDVVPLTKSKPCCHFARQACMKGDECPYDHELSKYPCNSYADTGFCSRGDSCLFSHKIPVKAASEPSSVPLKCDSISADKHDVSKSKQQFDAIVPSTSGKSTPANLKDTLTTKTIKPAKRPKGLSFLSFGSYQPDDSVQPEESVMSQQSNNTTGTYVQPNMVAEAVPNSRKTPRNIPGSGAHGINYCSFEKNRFDGYGRGNQPRLSTHYREHSSRDNSSGDPILNYALKYKRNCTSEAFDSSELPSPTPTPERVPNFSTMYSESPTMIPGTNLDLSEILKGIPSTTLTPTPEPERAAKVSEMPKVPTLIPERALNLSDMSKGMSPTIERSLNVSEMSKGTTPIAEGARKISEMHKGTSTVTLTPERALDVSEISKGTAPVAERALKLPELLKGTPTVTPALERALNVSEISKGPTPIAERALKLPGLLKGTPTPTPTPERSLNVSEISKGSMTIPAIPAQTASATRERSLNLAEMLKDALTQAKAKGSSVSSSDVPMSDISRGKSASVISTEQEKRNINAAEKLLKVDNPVKKPVNNTQRALQSALAFASKYESGIKMNPTAAAKENNLNGGTSFKQSEPLQASKILQFLNRQGDKENK